MSTARARRVSKTRWLGRRPKRYVSLEGGLTWLDLRNASSEGTFGDFKGDRIPNRPYLTEAGAPACVSLAFRGMMTRSSPFYNGRYVHGLLPRLGEPGALGVQAGRRRAGRSQWRRLPGRSAKILAASRRPAKSTTSPVPKRSTTLVSNAHPGRAFYLKVAAEI